MRTRTNAYKPHPRQGWSAAAGIAATVFGKRRVVQSRRHLDCSKGASLDDTGVDQDLNLR